jgi:tetratricopeptide (TPR) repeat protein
VNAIALSDDATGDRRMVAAHRTGPATASNGGLAISGAVAGDVNFSITAVAHQFSVEAWPTESPREVVGWRRQPSRLLAAANEIVPFGFRGEELAELAAWRDRIEGLAARLLYGPGGQGKTRLAARFAADSAAAGWAVARVRHASDRAAASAAPVDLVGQVQGLLLVVDYAERWRIDDLLDLFSHTLLHQGVPTKVLLLARPARWWVMLGHRLEQLGVTADNTQLSALARDPMTRAEVFQAAVDRFAEPDLYHLSGTGVEWPPGLDSDDAYGQVLTVHMAALAAVDAAARGSVPPDDPDGLSSYLLAREWEHWRLLHATKFHSGYTTAPDVMARTVYTAILTRAHSYEAGIALLDQTGIASDAASAGRILDDHAICYPPVRASTVLEPLYPDRLAEDFLALLTPGHADTAVTDAWAATAASRLLVRAADGLPPEHASAAMVMLVETARRWPHVANEVLYPLLRTCPSLGLVAGGAVLAQLAEVDDLPTDVLEAIDRVLPTDRHVGLDVAAAAIAIRLTPRRLATATNPRRRADLHSALAIRLHRAGQLEQALAPARAAVDIYRQSSAAGWSERQSVLAQALSNLGTILSDLGRRDEALDVTSDAVDLCRQSSAAGWSERQSVLAQALSNLGTILSDLGRRDEALEITSDAVDLGRQLAAAEGAAYEPYLARGLNNLSVYLSREGRLEEALAATTEAYEIRLRLAAENPAAHAWDLAAALTNLGVRLASLGQDREALRHTARAVEIGQLLAAVNATAPDPILAMALNNLGADLSAVGRRAEALDVTAEAVEIYRHLAVANPTAHKPGLAAALNNLGTRRAGMGQHQAALDATFEMVGIRRQLAAVSRVDESELAAGLRCLGVRLSRVSRWEEALAPATEAVDIYRRLATADPATYQRDLARALNDVGAPLSRLGRHEEAHAITTEALGMWPRLAVTGAPAPHRWTQNSLPAGSAMT